MHRLLLAAVLAATALAPQSHAQSAPEIPKGALTVRLLAEVVPEAIGKVCLVAGDARTAALDLPANNVSDPIPVAGRTLQLRTVEKNLNLCSFTLPEAGKSFVVIFSPAKPAGYHAEMVRTDDPSFRRGDVFFLNRTEKTILGKLGSKPLVLAPGKSAITRPEGATDGAYYDIAFAARGEAGDKLLSTVRWPLDDQIRSYVFFVQDPSGRITYRAVDEFMPADKPQS